MAEFCKRCFIDRLMDSRDQTLYKQEKITLVMSEDNDFCEECGKILPVVIRIVRK